MLRLPDVTLVMIETMDHELARLAVNDCVRKVAFGDVLILTDKRESFEPLDCEAKFVHVENWPKKIGWSRSSWFDVPQHIKTSQTMYIQWDGFVWDTGCWNDDYLDYDLIGAPWPWHPDRRVGNLGFSLRSTRLIKYVYKHRDRYPCTTDVDDDLLCRKYRASLEADGFVWAPEPLAERFAFECAPPDLQRRHFGFHAAQNMKYVLEHDDLLERARLMKESPYIGGKNSYMWQNFCKACPEVIEELHAGEAA